MLMCIWCEKTKGRWFIVKRKQDKLRKDLDALSMWQDKRQFKTGMLTRTRPSYRIQGQGLWHSKAKAKDMSFMVKAKGQDAVFSRTFHGLLPAQCFITHITLLCGPKVYCIQIAPPWHTGIMFSGDWLNPTFENTLWWLVIIKINAIAFAN